MLFKFTKSVLCTSDHRQVNVLIAFIAGKGIENIEISERGSNHKILHSNNCYLIRIFLFLWLRSSTPV